MMQPTQTQKQQKQKQTSSSKSNKNYKKVDVDFLDFQSYRDSDEYRMNQRNMANNNNRSRRGSHHKKHQTPQKAQLTGMKFINVNFKFVVDERKDYKIQEMDPNVPLDIDDIVQVISPKGHSCPICLSDTPTAPRMITSCGHIICLKCVLSLLESEVPKYKKKEADCVVEKYRECPLCSSIIRKKELKPVLVNPFDERFEIPKIGDEVVFQLMTRQGITFPNIKETNFPNIKEFTRIFRADYDYILSMYEEEKKSIMDVYEQEKLLYGDDFGLVSESINYIDHEIEIWKKKFDRTVQNVTSVTHDPDAPPQHPFYFYQTGFNSGNTYILSPFDLKLLKTTYKNYFSFPSVLLAKMESIHYDELNEQNVHTKFKYLSHLPIGTQIGFIECDWSNNELINKETWEMFKEDLLKRTKNSKRKFKKEERDKKRAMNEEEVKTRNFYMRENGHDQGEEEAHESTFGMGSLSILDNRELPALSDHQHSTESEREYETTVWGTRIPKGEAAPGSSSAIADDEDNEYEEMIRKAKEEMAKQEQNGKRKKKKKLVLISS